MTATAYAPMTLAKLAVHLSSTDSHERRWRWVLEFLEEFSHEISGSDSERWQLLAEQPGSCGDVRWDTLVAALAEHLSWIDQVDAPSWCTKPELMWFGKVWFIDPLPSARAWALAHSPASFRRRGIFLHPDDLSRA